jgi:photosystem II stability/assembly factor-like uncharacterized protein
MLFTCALIVCAKLIYAQSGWVLQYSSAKTVFGIDFINENTGICVGNSGLILKTTNKGDNWILAYAPDTTKPLHTIKYLDNDRIIIGGFHTILKSTNSGDSWSSIVVPPDLIDIDISGDKVILCGDNRVFRSINRGDNWTEQTIPGVYGIYWLKGICFSDSNTCYIVTTEYTGFPQSLSLGRILKSTNGGINWNTIFTTYGPASTGDSVFYDVFFVNENYGYASGKNTLFYTTNAGFNWINISGNSNLSDSQRLYFFSSLTGYNIGTSHTFLHSIICKTTDAGLSWSTQLNIHSGNYQSRFYGISFVNSNTGWVCGYNNGGVIYRTTNGGVTSLQQISFGIPVQFLLFQNYPNPFNPTTNIKFDIPKASFVKLIVYDVLGRELRTLVNEQLKAGTYKADWYASAFPSGVYFYKLSAGDFTETKKMVLVK